MSATLSHLADGSTVDAAVLNGHSDEFARSLKAAHTALRAEIDRDLESRPYAHTVYDARFQSQMVGTRAAMMSQHLAAMLSDADGTGDGSSSSGRRGRRKAGEDDAGQAAKE